MLVRTPQYRKGIGAQFLYVGLQTAVWSFTIRVALELYPGMNEREATNFMIVGFTCFLVGKFVANALIARFSAARVLVVYCAIGAGLLVVAAFGPSASAIWFVIASNLVMGPCWPTIFGQTLDTIDDKRYQETAGAILVMAIVGGAVVPVVQGAVSDALGSLQMSFVVSAACFLGIPPLLPQQPAPPGRRRAVDPGVATSGERRRGKRGGGEREGRGREREGREEGEREREEGGGKREEGEGRRGGGRERERGRRGREEGGGGREGRGGEEEGEGEGRRGGERGEGGERGGREGRGEGERGGGRRGGGRGRWGGGKEGGEEGGGEQGRGMVPRDDLDIGCLVLAR